HGGRDLGLVAAAGRQPAGGERAERLRRLGVGRVRRRRGGGGGARRHRRPQASLARVRRHRRDGLEGGARLRRAHAHLRGARGVKRATLERLLASARAQQPVVLATDLESGERQWFLRPWSPPVRMVLVGAVHIAQPLAAMAALAEYAVTIVDPRRAFATPERFPGVTLLGD